MWKIVELTENYRVLTEEGEYLSTFGNNGAIEPIEWDKKYNSREGIAETIRKVWGKETI